MSSEGIKKWHEWFQQQTKGLIKDQATRIAVNQHVHLALIGATLTQDVLTKQTSENKCWFCNQNDEGLVYEVTFDTYVHLACVRTALHIEPLHPEANCMKYLFKPL